MSEKLDGVRAYWDGKQFLSRQGNLYHAPDWFTAGLPDHAARRRAVGRPQEVPAHGEHRAAAGQERPLEGGRFVVFDAPADRRRLRGAARALPAVRARTWRRRTPTGCEHEPLPGPGAPARGAGPGGGARRRGADAAPARLALRGRPLVHAAEGQDLPRRRGARGGPLAGHGQAQGAAGGAGGGAARRHRASRWAPASPTRSARTRPPSARIITFRYQELSDGGVPRFPSYVGVRIDAAPFEVVARRKRA